MGRQFNRSYQAFMSVIDRIDLHENGLYVDIHFQSNTMLQVPI